MLSGLNFISIKIRYLYINPYLQILKLRSSYQKRVNEQLNWTRKHNCTNITKEHKCISKVSFVTTLGYHIVIDSNIFQIKGIANLMNCRYIPHEYTLLFFYLLNIHKINRIKCVSVDLTYVSLHVSLTILCTIKRSLRFIKLKFVFTHSRSYNRLLRKKIEFLKYLCQYCLRFFFAMASFAVNVSRN